MASDRSLSYFTRALPQVLAVSVIGFGLNALIFVAMARFLNPANFGNLKVAASIMLVASIAVGLGGGRAAGRFLPRRLRGSVQAHGYLWFYIRIILLLTVILTAVIWSFVLLDHAELPHDIHGHHPVSFVVLLVPVWAGLDLLSQSFMATRRPVLASLPARFVFPVVGLAVITAAHFSGLHLSDVMFVILLSGAGFVTLVVFAIYLWYLEMVEEPVGDPTDGSQDGPRQWLALSLPMVGAALVVDIVARIPLFVMALAGDEAEVGLYGAAMVVTQIFLIVVTCQRQIYGPSLAAALAEGPEAARRLQAHAQKMTILFVTPLLTAVALGAEPLLMLFGPDFAAGQYIVWILAGGLSIAALTGLSARWLDYGGHARLVLKAEVAAALAMFAGALVLVPYFGAIGGAAAFAVVVGCRSIYLAVMASRRLGLPLVAYRLGVERTETP
jgi:O-antigen/teichoic acid export membrane protein